MESAEDVVVSYQGIDMASKGEYLANIYYDYEKFIDGNLGEG